MRPARKGPENLGRALSTRGAYGSFNEAGPQGAGKPYEFAKSGIRFNAASMRPARKGPENPATANRSAAEPGRLQ